MMESDEKAAAGGRRAVTRGSRGPEHRGKIISPRPGYPCSAPVAAADFMRTSA